MMNVFNMDDNKSNFIKILIIWINIELGTVIICISAFLYGFGILMFFDRAFLMLGNILFVCGLCFLVGVSETFMFFARKIKGSLALIIGLIFIIIKWKFIGAICQIYGIYQFRDLNTFPWLSSFFRLLLINYYITLTAICRYFFIRTKLIVLWPTRVLHLRRKN